MPGHLKPDAEPIGMTLTGKTWKNSLCSPYRRLNLEIRFTGKLSVNQPWEVAVFGRRLGVFRAKNGGEISSGSNWCYDGAVVGRSQYETEQFLRENPDLAEDISMKIRAAMESVD